MLIVLLPLLTGCGGADSKVENTFFYNEHDNFNTLDPARIGARASGWAGSQIFIGLIGLDSALQPVPMIARSWSVSEDGRTWTFNLRNDVLFADDACFPDGKGRKVVAEDIRYSFERILRPETKSSGDWVFRGKVVGAEEFAAALSGDSTSSVTGVSGFRAVNDTTFQIELVQPFAPFLSMLAIPYCFVVPREAVEKYKEDFFRHPVGAGPFKLVEWVPDLRVTMTRNPNYFERDAEGKQLPYLDSISISFERDLGVEFTQFQSGKLDMISGVDPAAIDLVFTEGGQALTPAFSKYTLFTKPAMSVEYYGFILDKNTPGGATSPFADNRYLRRAFNHAIDRDAIARYVLKGQAIAAHHGPIPPGTPGFSGVEGYKFDRELARRLIDSAGYPNGKGLPRITLTLGKSELSGTVAETIQEQLKSIGVNIELKQMDFPTMREMYKSGKLPFWRASWIGDYPDAENFMGLFYSRFIPNQGPNITHFINAEFDSLYAAALDPHLTIDQRAAIYGRAERIVLDEAPWIVLSYSILQRLTQPGVTGYSVDPLDRLNLTYVRKQKQS